MRTTRGGGPARPRGRAVVAVGAAALAAAVLGGCRLGATPSPPTGVDQLLVPTPSPSPRDYVAAVDNPWFPLPVGARWTYRRDGFPARDVVVRTAERGPVLAGVATTAVRTTVRGPAATGGEVVRDFYAQDIGGNVWWFGHQIVRSADPDDVAWTADDALAQPGLVVTAAPRLGDGYRAALVGDPRGTGAPGEPVPDPTAATQVDQRATVVGLEGTSTVPAGHFADEVVIDLVDVPHDRQVRLFLARGTGVVQTQPLDGGTLPGWRLAAVRLP